MSMYTINAREVREVEVESVSLELTVNEFAGLMEATFGRGPMHGAWNVLYAAALDLRDNYNEPRPYEAWDTAE